MGTPMIRQTSEFWQTDCHNTLKQVLYSRGGLWR